MLEVKVYHAGFNTVNLQWKIGDGRQAVLILIIGHKYIYWSSKLAPEADKFLEMCN